MPQYTFSATRLLVEGEVQQIADREGRSRSEMICILLQAAVKERKRNRDKNAKKASPKHNTTDSGS